MITEMCICSDKKPGNWYTVYTCVYGPRLWRYANHLLTYLLTRKIEPTPEIYPNSTIDYNTPFLEFDYQLNERINKLEIRSVEHGICPIAEFTSP